MPPISPAPLRQQLTDAFSDEELRTLCFDVGIDYASLPGDGKAAKARELVALVQRTGRLTELLAQAKAHRPHLEWALPVHPTEGSLVVVNFSHPLTIKHVETIKRLARDGVGRELGEMAKFDLTKELAAQVSELVDRVGLSSGQWQTEPILINPPGYQYATAILLAELHGRMGHFPTIIRMRPVPNSTPTQYEVVELLNLQAVRDRVREQR